jgi:conjugal transfer pilin signal peptidase TrbI
MKIRPPAPLVTLGTLVNATARRVEAISAISAQAVWQRFDAAAYRARVIRHFQRWTLAYLLAALAAIWFDAHYTLALNVTESLPVRFFLIHRGEQPRRGDYVAFSWRGGGPYPIGATFVKVVAGVPGDIVTQVDGDFFVNCRPIGLAKSKSRQGSALEPGPTGTLPEGSYYVHAPHPDSLDSRYALTGWVLQAQIIGRAHALF